MSFEMAALREQIERAIERVVDWQVHSLGGDPNVVRVHVELPSWCIQLDRTWVRVRARNLETGLTSRVNFDVETTLWGLDEDMMAMAIYWHAPRTWARRLARDKRET